MAKALTIRPDSKGRITLGKLARGVSSFQATLDAEGRIILDALRGNSGSGEVVV